MESTTPGALAESPITIDDIGNTVRLLAITTRDDTRPHPSSNLVQPSLIAQLRSNIIPDGDGLGGRKAASERSPINAAALDLYEYLVRHIGRLYKQGTDRHPIGSPEELLVAWFVELAIQAANGEVIQAQFDTLNARLEDWRTRIMDLFNPPERMEIPYACPDCGCLHITRNTPEGTIRQYALVGIARPWKDYQEGVICRGPDCGSEWLGEKPMLELAADLGVDLKKYFEPATDAPEVLPTPPAPTLWLCVMTAAQAKDYARAEEIDPKLIVLASGATRRLRAAEGPIRTATTDAYTPGPHEAARVNEARRVAQIVNAMNGYDVNGNRIEEPS